MLKNTTVVSVTIKPEIQRDCGFIINLSTKKELGGSSGPTVEFQGLKLVQCDQNTSLNSVLNLKFHIHQTGKSMQITPESLELEVTVIDDKAQDASVNALETSKKTKNKVALRLHDEIQVHFSSGSDLLL